MNQDNDQPIPISKLAAKLKTEVEEVEAKQEELEAKQEDASKLSIVRFIVLQKKSRLNRFRLSVNVANLNIGSKRLGMKFKMNGTNIRALN
jgi:hypothetical protein